MFPVPENEDFDQDFEEQFSEASNDEILAQKMGITEDFLTVDENPANLDQNEIGIFEASGENPAQNFNVPMDLGTVDSNPGQEIQGPNDFEDDDFVTVQSDCTQNTGIISEKK